MSVFPAGVVPPEETFALWQPRYAAHGILTFPVEIIGNNKKPMIEHYLKIGWRYSTELTRDPRCATATAIGAPLGKRTGLFIADLDSADPAIVPEGERLFGRSPILWRTGGGNFAMPFRWNGERREIRPFGIDLPIDALGGGYAVLPPSLGEIGRYEFLRGSLADFEYLPVARIPDEIADLVYGRIIPEEIAALMAGRPGLALRAIKNGTRNKTMLRELLKHAPHCDTLDALRDVATTINADNCLPPLDPGELDRAISQAWKYETAGSNWVGQEQRVHAFASELDRFDAHKDGQYGLRLLLELRRRHNDEAEFAISPKAMAEAQVIPGWSARAYRLGRDAMVEIEAVNVVHQGGSGPKDAYSLCFAKAAVRKGAKSEPNTKKIPLPPSPEGTERQRPAAACPAPAPFLPIPLSAKRLKKSGEIGNSTAEPHIAGSTTKARNTGGRR